MTTKAVNRPPNRGQSSDLWAHWTIYGQSNLSKPFGALRDALGIPREEEKGRRAAN